MNFTLYSPLLWLLALGVMVVAWRYSLVDRPRWTKIASFWLRALGIVLLALALCRPFWRDETESRHLAFLIDVSESVELGKLLERTHEIQEEIDGLSRADSFSIFLYGDGLRPVASLEEAEQILTSWDEGIGDAQFRSHSKLAAALQQSRIAFPSGKSREVIIWSDGQPTDQDRLPEALDRLKNEAVHVRFVSLDGREESEAALVSLRPSVSKAYENEVVRLNIDATANEAMSAQLRILHRGVVVAERPIELAPDRDNRVHIDVNMSTPGAGQWTAELVPERDFFVLNNQLSTTIDVQGQPRILAIHEKPQEMRPFSRLLKEQGFSIDTRGEKGLPESLEGMLAFDAILLADVPATAFSMEQMELLRRYVSDFGGGLGMLGSENSFGLGGYYKTPVEEVLPLTSRYEKEKEKPSLAMVLVIDKSGSMSGAPISLARQAAKAAVELLSARDQIAVIGFDSNPQIIVEMSPASDKLGIQNAIDSLAAGGGTDVFPSMQVGQEMLYNSASKIKHMIILSDGQTSQADHLGLTQEMADSGVTVSTVALGEGAARDLMASIAEVGRGRYYETLDPSTVPQIFTRETMQASKSAIKEDLFETVQVGDHPMLFGYEEAELPFTLGYVMTEIKPTAQSLLIAETGDPLLAIYRFGLGTGMSFSSDLTERWGGEWLAWSEGGKFWAQVLRGMVRKADVEGIHTQSRLEGNEWVVDISRTEHDGTPIIGAEWSSIVVRSHGAGDPIEVKETGMGSYQARIPLADNDKQLSLRLHDQESDKLAVIHQSRPYPAEYRLGGEIPDRLAALQQARSSEERITSHRHHPITHWFVFAAMICLIAGILLRRV